MAVGMWLLERTDEVGAGIQVSPNMLRILSRLGLCKAIEQRCVGLRKIVARRWQDGAVLQTSELDASAADAPKTIHRADLHAVIVEAALALPNMHLRLGSRVADFDFANAAVTLHDGSRVAADVLIAADGIKSRAREQLLASVGERAPSAAEPTGDATYRIMLPRETMLQDAQLRQLIDSPTATRWIGPNRHVMAYPISNHQRFNVVLIHPDRGDKDEAWTSAGSREDMVRDYEGWDPVVRKLIDRAPADEILEWKLCMHKPLPTWVSGRGALLGDACHPMLPYVAQGAAQAVEDAACLSIVLSGLSGRHQIPLALRSYEASRKPRAEIVQAFGLANRDTLHLPDGPEQERRDEAYRQVKNGGPSPDKWVDDATQRFLWGWDAEVAALQTWMLNSMRPSL
ncbi:hypothetical protein KEM52_000692 [Ascosphaera acerosa]|nr:hypothetical protein KEM52_000692 [Ascosphaera acerosa]